MPFWRPPGPRHGASAVIGGCPFDKRLTVAHVSLGYLFTMRDRIGRGEPQMAMVYSTLKPVSCACMSAGSGERPCSSCLTLWNRLSNFTRAS